MAAVVFMRGVNVGGRKTFRPATLARELAAFDVVSVGAAGTFVVRKTVSHATLRAEFVRRLPFEAELMICRASEVMDIAAGDLFPDEASVEGVRRFVSVMAKRPQSLTNFPITQPAGDGWQVKVIGVHGRFALSLSRRTGRTMVYPNEVVEKSLGVPATTRNWNTISRISDILNDS